jgi:hypothetical protein
MSTALSPVQLLVAAFDEQLAAADALLERLRVETVDALHLRDRLAEARQVLVAWELPASAVPATARREQPTPSAASPATTPTSEPSKAAPWNKGKRAPQKPRDCPVCGETFGGGPALSSHMRSKHPATETQPSAPARNKLTEEQRQAGQLASQGERECPVCHGTYGSAPALATHISLRHPAFKAKKDAEVPSVPARPSIDEIQELEAAL